jgi:putative peptidoglycan lipid II flippase
MKRRGASLVAAGILLSRLLGLVRQRVMGHYLGLSDAADAFNAAFRIPNFLQNLFGEGVLSASFIPIYARLRAEGRDLEASRVAGAVAAILGLATSTLVVAGVAAAPWLVDLVAPGFEGEKRELVVLLVRILFPGSGLLVLSAWCLGVLNSHRKFFLSYAAPVAWNVAIIVALIAAGARLAPYGIARAAAWGAVVGSALQLAVQIPPVLALLGGLRLVPDFRSVHVREIAKNFMPVFVGRGVVQISAYVDTLIASLLPTGAVAALGNVQVLYMLPISLFGMAVSAAELPEMSSAIGPAEAAAAHIRGRLTAGLDRIAFFVVPSAVAFGAFGDIIAGALFQTGRFTHADAVYVWGVLGGSAVGLVASTRGRLYASAFYAIRDTVTPLKFALVRVVLTTGLGLACALPLPHLLGIEARWGAAGLTASAGIAGWVEFALLRRALRGRIGADAPAGTIALWAAALVAAGAGWGIRLWVGVAHPIATAAAVLAPFGALYVGLAAAMGVAEARTLLDRARRLRL